MSLLFPLFWAGLGVLLSVDFLHYRTQRFFLYHARAGTTFAAYAYDAIRTKFHISFVRSFSEAAVSSFSCSCICVLVHTSLVDTAVETKLWEWESYLLLPQNQTERMTSYLFFLSPTLVDKIPTSKVSDYGSLYVVLVLALIEQLPTWGMFKVTKTKAYSKIIELVVVEAVVIRKSVTLSEKKVWEKYKRTFIRRKQ